MNENRFYVACPVARQMMTEATGEDWSGADEDKIRSEVPAQTPLAFGWKSPFRAADGTDADFLDDLYRRLAGEYAGIFKIRAAEDPKCRGSSRIHYQGILLGPNGGVCNCINIHTENGDIRLIFDRKTKIQKHYFAENEVVHIYAAENNVARFVIDDDVHRALCYFYGEEFDEIRIDEYLKLSLDERRMITALALNQDLRKSVVFGMAYCASVLMLRSKEKQSVDLENIAQEYNSSVAPNVDCVPIPEAWFVGYAGLLFDVDPEEQILSDDVLLDATLNRMSMYAALAGCSALDAFPLKGWKPLHISQMAALVPKDRVGRLLDQMLEEDIGGKENVTVRNEWIFAMLMRNPNLPQAYMERIARTLFRETIDTDQVRAMEEVLSGPNGEGFRSFIFDSFYKSYASGTAAYYYCAASILNSERVMKKDNPIACAVAEMEKAGSTADFLLNSLCLGMIAWYPVVGKQNFRNEIQCITLGEPLVEKLCSFLTKLDKQNYLIAVSVIHDLIARGAVRQDVLTDRMRCTALEALQDLDIRRRAEDILSLIDFPDAEPDSAESGKHAPLAEEYRRRFASSLEDPENEDTPETLFAVLCHMNAWDTEDHCRKALKEIGRYYDENSGQAYHETVVRMGRYLKRFAHPSKFWTMHTTHVNPEELGGPLSEEAQDRISCLSKTLMHPDADAYSVSRVEEALEIIRYLTDLPSGDDSSAALVQKIRLNMPNPGSYLVRVWFRALCVYGFADLALEFYREYRDILDLPEYVISASGASADTMSYPEFRRYAGGDTRAEASLSQAIRRGHLSVLEAFMNSEFRAVVDCKKFATRQNFRLHNQELREKISRIYEGRYGLDEACVKNRGILGAWKSGDICRDRDIASVACLEKCTANFYYDDRSVLEFYLMHISDSRCAVLWLGYADDADLVRLAVSRDGTNLQYASARLQADEEICRCALRNSSDALPYVKGDMLRNTAEVKEILLENPCGLKLMPEEYRSDRDIVMAAVRHDPAELRYAPECFRADRGIVKEALQQPRKSFGDPLAVQFIAEELTDDKELMLLAVRANYEAYDYASARLKQDPDMQALGSSIPRDLLQRINAMLESLKESN